ncbi:uncharacterized protein EV420DRAFT_1753512 [Desarmillaria tabescens]|uniref:Uncharacterized protein n=1 Tax=Armillaria tabescens TaxID=1929756 RepID=A0AA39J6Y1_ARMTA|nr:uncharacterized protein EV420DRAFT_1753512 [Desarmillaria tabescens]KAK0437290.1 hypothetical protein EV420DRAFT_1753512 [Desarmillaria tabescens]
MSKSKRRNQRQVRPPAASAPSEDTVPGEDALEFLFNYRPKFKKPTGFEGSDGTRGTAQYDMHLHSQLILKDIILFPDMLEQLAGAVNSQHCTSTGSIRDLPPVPEGHDLHRLSVHQNLQEFEGIEIGPEVDLQRQYPKLQNISSLVASTLVAGLGQWSSIFQYSEKPISMMPYALADGYLSLNKDIVAKAGLPDDLDSDIQLVIETGLSDFLFWEFKSMNAGSEGVMQAISHLAGSKFPWVRCPTSQSCGGRFCQKTNNRFQFTVTGHKTGVDGGILEDTSDIKSGVSNRRTPRLDKSNIDLSPTSVLNTSGWKFKLPERKLRKAGSKRKPASPDEVGGDNSEDECDASGGADDGSVHRLPFTKGDFYKALKIIQQVWAEAVNVDVTFMVLNAGSREFIGIRDRNLQRLYLSPLIDLDNPGSLPAGYFKIHAGLQIAALHDVILRAKRLKALSRRPKLHTFRYDRGEPYPDKEPNTIKTTRPCKSTATPKAAKAKISEVEDKENENDEDYYSGSELTSEEQQLFRRLRKAGSLEISWNTHIDGLGQASSMTVTRITQSNARPLNCTKMEVHVMDQYPKSTHSYYCYVDNGQVAVRGIVIKFAQFPHERKGLRKEYDMYTKLWRIESIATSLGIPEHFGLYKFQDKMVLVLLDSGDPAPTKFRNRTPNDIYAVIQGS